MTLSKSDSNFFGDFRFVHSYQYGKALSFCSKRNKDSLDVRVNNRPVDVFLELFRIISRSGLLRCLPARLYFDVQKIVPVRDKRD